MLYFAYGSNMHPLRLQARVSRVESISIGRLMNHRLTFHKRGADGSGKGDVLPVAGDEVWGAIYRLGDADLSELDRIEGPGYRRQEVEIHESAGAGVTVAWTYRARPEVIDADLLPYDWYLAWVTGGARLHGLPAAYREALQGLAALQDPDTARARQEWSGLAAGSDQGAGT